MASYPSVLAEFRSHIAINLFGMFVPLSILFRFSLNLSEYRLSDISSLPFDV